MLQRPQSGVSPEGASDDTVHFAVLEQLYERYVGRIGDHRIQRRIHRSGAYQSDPGIALFCCNFGALDGLIHILRAHAHRYAGIVDHGPGGDGFPDHPAHFLMSGRAQSLYSAAASVLSSDRAIAASAPMRPSWLSNMSAKRIPADTACSSTASMVTRRFLISQPKAFRAGGMPMPR